MSSALGILAACCLGLAAMGVGIVVTFRAIIRYNGSLFG